MQPPVIAVLFSWTSIIYQFCVLFTERSTNFFVVFFFHKQPVSANVWNPGITHHSPSPFRVKNLSDYNINNNSGGCVGIVVVTWTSDDSHYISG